MKINAYIDGFNLYHSIVRLNEPKLKWLDLRLLCEKFLKDDDKLNKIYYFSALPTHLPDKISRHKIYINALKSKNITPILGKFKKKFPKCKICHQTYESYEEKQSDINIAITMLKDALSNEFDKAFLISADTDLVSTIKMIRSFGKIIILLTPPNSHRYAHELIQNANFSFEIKKSHLKNSLLDDE